MTFWTEKKKSVCVCVFELKMNFSDKRYDEMEFRSIRPLIVRRNRPLIDHLMMVGGVGDTIVKKCWGDLFH